MSPFLILSIFVLATASQAAALNVTVYYESLCPDSIRFITKQLAPTYSQLVFNVRFVPYGKASHTTDPWSIQCQHGADECLGNAVQACALKKYTDTATQVKFVNCVMGSSYPTDAGSDCAESLGLDYSGIPACSTSEEGHRLLAANGDETHALQPALSFVPTIIFNGVFNQNTQDSALSNLKNTICKAEPTVTGCPSRRRYKHRVGKSH